jgi:hypothetical protein
MTPRERVRKAIRRDVPDRIPLDLGSKNCTTMTRKACTDVKKELGVRKEDDFIMHNFRKETIDERTCVSERGIAYHMPENGLYYDMTANPLGSASLQDLERYEFPDPDDGERELARRIDELGPGGYVLTSVHDARPDVPGKNVMAMFHAAREYGARGGGS